MVCLFALVSLQGRHRTSGEIDLAPPFAIESVQTAEKAFDRVLGKLRRNGLLLESDSALPSVVRIVVGERIEASWWGHRDGHLIFNVMKRLRSSPEILEAKLISGKVTLIYKTLWPELFAVGSSRDRWQMVNLSTDAKRLFDLVEKKGKARSDEILWRGKAPIGDSVRELEKRLLLHSEEIHTAKGSHAKIIRSWRHLANESANPMTPVNVESAKEKFETLVGQMNKEHDAHGRLPWPHTENDSSDS
jgi:hypothetical protein